MILAVSGSIAAFKAASLASMMVKEEFELRVIMTGGAARFIAPLTFEALTSRPVGMDIWDDHSGASPMGHLDLARWGHLLVVAPASAGALARLALGLPDDLLGAVALATSARLLVAPAMESSMYAHPATQEHLGTLRGRGAVVVGPQSGRLASGAEGPGRMSEPAEILAAIREVLGELSDLKGKRILVTAGPTFEPIDRVRFLGNRSSGKMGYAIARQAAARGASVYLVTGPSYLAPPETVETIRVESALEMQEAVLGRVGQMDAVVMAAAVSDFRPATQHEGKLKRAEAINLALIPTPDIAAAAAAAAPRALHIGFALEAGDLIEAARDKLVRKRQDLVVANEVTDRHNPFGSDTNEVAFVTSEGVVRLPPLSKDDVARRLCDEIARRLRP